MSPNKDATMGNEMSTEAGASSQAGAPNSVQLSGGTRTSPTTGNAPTSTPSRQPVRKPALQPAPEKRKPKAVSENIIQSIKCISLDYDPADICLPIFYDRGEPERQRRETQFHYLRKKKRGEARPMTNKEVWDDYISIPNLTIERDENINQTLFDRLWDLPVERCDDGDEPDQRLWFTHSPFGPIPKFLDQAPEHIRNYKPKNQSLMAFLDGKQHNEDMMSKPGLAKPGYTYLDKNESIKRYTPLTPTLKRKVRELPHLHQDYKRILRQGNGNNFAKYHYEKLPHDFSDPFAGRGRNYDGGARGDDDENLGSTTHGFDLCREFNLRTFEEQVGFDELIIESQEADHNVRPKVKIDLADHIKSLLVDDWENVTKQQQLVPLPAKRTVNQILDEYMEVEKAKRVEGSPDMNLLEETVAGLKEYFDKTLGRILLYK